MDWNAIKNFLAVANTGSLSGAAKTLAVNHSTVFRRLNQFEQTMGVRLFERLNDGYQLTNAGEELYAQAKQAEELFGRMERKLIGRDFQPRGLVRITAPNNIVYKYLSQMLTDFNQRYPEIQTEILASNQEFNMSNRQADIAIRAASRVPESLVGRQVATIPWGIYVGSGTSNNAGLPKALLELERHRLIGAAGGLRNLPGFLWLDKHFSQNICLRCDDLVAMSSFAEAGLGLALLPDDQQHPGIQKLFTFEEAAATKLWVLTHADLRNVERIRLVMRFLSDRLSDEDFSVAIRSH